jgi:hypothetical protein
VGTGSVRQDPTSVSYSSLEGFKETEISGFFSPTSSLNSGASYSDVLQQWLLRDREHTYICFYLFKNEENSPSSQHLVRSTGVQSIGCSSDRHRDGWGTHPILAHSWSWDGAWVPFLWSSATHPLFWWAQGREHRAWCGHKFRSITWEVVSVVVSGTDSGADHFDLNADSFLD